MVTNTRAATIVASLPPSHPRLSLAPTRAAHAVLDGAWWPRSRDAVIELPGLVLALSKRHGRIRQVMLSSAAWDGRFRRLDTGFSVLRAGWFTSLDPALVIATTDRGDQIDLLVIPPSTSPAAARQAMATAADPANVLRAPAVLASALTGPSGRQGPAEDPKAVWDNEGGRIPRAIRPRRPLSRLQTR